ncbi:MAG: flagellar biosynthetic protein FliQ [Phycisphaerae bacterium]
MDLALYLSKRTIEVALILSAPVLIVALSTGLLTAMLQAVTSVRDMTLGMVLKIAAVGVTVLIFGSWMLQVAMAFTVEIFNHMRQMVQ